MSEGNLGATRADGVQGQVNVRGHFRDPGQTVMGGQPGARGCTGVRSCQLRCTALALPSGRGTARKARAPSPWPSPYKPPRAILK